MTQTHPQDRRVFTRVPVDLWVEERHQGMTYYQRATNLSLGGLFLDRTLPHPPGTRVRLAVRLGAEPVELVGEVVRSPDDEGMHLRFVDLRREQRARLADYLLAQTLRG